MIADGLLPSFPPHFPPMIELPASPEAFRDATWDDVLPLYNQLADVPLSNDSATIEPWLVVWSRLDTLVSEAGTLAMIAYTANTADAAAEAAYLRFSMEIFPRLEEQQVRLARRLLDLGWSRPDLRNDAAPLPHRHRNLP